MHLRMKMSARLMAGSFAIGMGVAVLAAGTTPVLAESCFVAPAKLSDTAIQSFIATPDNLLSANPVGGYALTTQVRSLAGSDTDTLPALIALAANATPEQVAAIGAGLAQAATACINNRPDVAALIQQALAGSGNSALIVAFAATSGNTQTAALGGGAVGGTGGATGGGAAGIGGGPAGAGTDGPDSTFSNGATNLSASGSGGNISTTDTTRVQTVAPAGSVSPTI